MRPRPAAYVSAVSPYCKSEPQPPHTQLQRYHTGDTKQKNEPKLQIQRRYKELILKTQMKKRSTTHITLSLSVSPGREQQPHTVRVAILSCPHQRRESILQDGAASAYKKRTKIKHEAKRKENHEKAQLNSSERRLTLLWASLSAPASSSSRTQFARPFSAAHISAVNPPCK